MLSGSTRSTSGILMVCFFKSITILSGNFLFLLDVNCFDAKLSALSSSKTFVSTEDVAILLLCLTSPFPLLLFGLETVVLLLRSDFDVDVVEEVLEELSELRFRDLLLYSLM